MNEIIKECIKDIIELQKSVKIDYENSEADQNYIGLSGGTLGDFHSVVIEVEEKLNNIIARLNKIIK